MDAVITWVDGLDPAHQEKRRCNQEDRHLSYSAGYSETRYRQVGEIYFSIASILKYAPFFQKIWIVTDQQKPAFLDEFVAEGICDPDKIALVDHKDIFDGYRHCLPTFNSLTIETLLWAVPGLNERFVYFNDDVFLSASCKEEDFFLGNRPVVYCDALAQRETLLSVRFRRRLRRLTLRPERKTATMQSASDLSARIMGEERISYVPRHHPHPMRVSTQRTFYADNPAILGKQISFRFRNKDQFLPVALANMLEMREWGTSMVRSEHALKYFDPQREPLKTDPAQWICSGADKFLCMQSLDRLDQSQRDRILNILLEKYAGFYPMAVRSAMNGTPPLALAL